MPIYEYQCSKCGEIFEVFQKVNDQPVAQCRFCSGAVEKLISHTSFQLKGAGWYLTDYARKSSPGSEGKESSKPSVESKDISAKPAGKADDKAS